MKALGQELQKIDRIHELLEDEEIPYGWFEDFINGELRKDIKVDKLDIKHLAIHYHKTLKKVKGIINE